MGGNTMLIAWGGGKVNNYKYLMASFCVKAKPPAFIP